MELWEIPKRVRIFCNGSLCDEINSNYKTAQILKNKEGEDLIRALNGKIIRPAS